MSRPVRRLALAVSATVVVVGPAGPAMAKPTATATLQCGPSAYTVDGFGRGQVLHVTGSNQNFIVTRAVRTDDGTVVFDSPSKADRQLITCSTTTPQGTGFTFTGFLTPAG